jgi:hypothetical protein
MQRADVNEWRKKLVLESPSASRTTWVVVRYQAIPRATRFPFLCLTSSCKHREDSSMMAKFDKAYERQLEMNCKAEYVRIFGSCRTIEPRGTRVRVNQSRHELCPQFIVLQWKTADPFKNTPGYLRHHFIVVVRSKEREYAERKWKEGLRSEFAGHAPIAFAD